MMSIKRRTTHLVEAHAIVGVRRLGQNRRAVRAAIGVLFPSLLVEKKISHLQLFPLEELLQQEGISFHEVGDPSVIL